MRWLYAALVEGVLSGFAFLLLTGNYLNDGPVVVRVTAQHGLHEGDLFIMAGWVAASLSLAALTLRSGAQARAHTGSQPAETQ